MWSKIFIQSRMGARLYCYTALISMALVSGCVHLHEKIKDLHAQLPDLHCGMPLSFIPRMNGVVVCAVGQSIDWTQDGGRSWAVKAVVPSTIVGLIPKNDQELIVWTENDGVYSVHDGDGYVDRIIDLDSIRVTSMTASESLWVAWGKMPDDTAIADPCFDPQGISNGRLAGIVYVSENGGEDWRKVDTWNGRYILDVFALSRSVELLA